MLHGFDISKLVFLSTLVFTYFKRLFFSHSLILDYNLVREHAIKQLPRGSPDLCTQLHESHTEKNFEKIAGYPKYRFL